MPAKKTVRSSQPVEGDAFTGFPRHTLAFLRGLSKHNDKQWFDAHRDDYERYFMATARAFVTAIGPRVHRFAPGIRAEPRVNGSLMRINRDIRFSADKRPYKDHLDLILWEGDGKSRECPGMFFRLTGTRLFLGAGKHMFDSALLARYRDAVADDRTGGALAKVIARITAAGDYQIGGAHYKRVPRGFAADHPRADLLRHNSLHAMIEMAVPDGIHTPGFVDFCAGHFETMAPLHHWLVALHDA